MPESWNAATYRDRAHLWLRKAEELPAGKERDACLVLADGYLKLAELLEAQQGNPINPRSDLSRRSSRPGLEEH